MTFKFRNARGEGVSHSVLDQRNIKRSRLISASKINDKIEWGARDN